jgi:hypothetical protein
LRFDSYSAVILIAASQPAAVHFRNRTDSKNGQGWNFVRLSKKFFSVNKGTTAQFILAFPQADFNDRALTNVVSPPALTRSRSHPPRLFLRPRPVRAAGARPQALALSVASIHAHMHASWGCDTMHACMHAHTHAAVPAAFSPPRLLPAPMPFSDCTTAHLQTNPNSHRASLGPGGEWWVSLACMI